MRFFELNDWMEWLKTLHFKEVDLGLERVQLVADKLGLLGKHCPIITVAGTNGKGSTVAGLEAIYVAAGFRVGAYTSPCLFRLNEQIRINGVFVSDAELLDAFVVVDAARGVISLTQFEFYTLVALVIFKNARLDVWVLEVGLGGRWDAVNVMDADVGIVTSIALDHMEWLGDTREKIAVEKAGIFREGCPAICGDVDPPLSLLRIAEEKKLSFFCLGREFGFLKHEGGGPGRGIHFSCSQAAREKMDTPTTPHFNKSFGMGIHKGTFIEHGDESSDVEGSFTSPLVGEVGAKRRVRGIRNDVSVGEWDWWCGDVRWENLPMPRLALQNMACVLMAVHVLQDVLPVQQDVVRGVLENLELVGRIQVIPGDVTTILDVSHNPASAGFLVDYLREHPCTGKTRAVFSMLGDKDILATLNVIHSEISDWFVAPLTVGRAASMDQLKSSFLQAGISDMTIFSDVGNAYDYAMAQSDVGDRIVVFGSFHTVSEVLKILSYAH